MQLRQTRNELEAANLALHTMQNEPGIPEMRRAWQDFLNRLEKVWNKVKLECGEKRSGPIRQQLDRVTVLRRTDSLLQYLSQARHVEEHSLQSSNMFGLGMIITLPPGATVDLDLIRWTATAKGGDVSLKISKPQYCLLPVTNRGVTFKPPLVHLDKSFTDMGPVMAAQLGFEFYDNQVRIIEASLTTTDDV